MAERPIHFIADLHLDPRRPELGRLFLAYLAGPAREASHLYILGDLFEVWAGDEVSVEHYPNEIRALKELADQGVEIHFICGNRDFLCGPDFARAAGLKIVREPCSAELAGHRLILMHGDVLCTDDVAYQRFRRVVRMAWLQNLYSLLPKTLKLRLVRRIRGQTSKATRRKPQDILDVNPQAVTQLMSAHADRQVLIHGHTHRPADHALPEGRWRLVLADWSEQAGEVLILDRQGWRRQPLDSLG